MTIDDSLHPFLQMSVHNSKWSVLEKLTKIKFEKLNNRGWKEGVYPFARKIFEERLKFIITVGSRDVDLGYRGTSK